MSAIALENARSGTQDWSLRHPAVEHRVEGYASATSVQRGGDIDVFVHTTSDRVVVDHNVPTLRRSRRHPACERITRNVLTRFGGWPDPAIT